MKVSIGRIVHYVLTEQDVQQIERRRTTGSSIAERMKHVVLTAAPPHRFAWPEGAQAHIGNSVHAGQHLPLIVCVVWPNEYGPTYDGVNGQVFLDGNDTLWVTSVRESTTSIPACGEWHWPEREE